MHDSGGNRPRRRDNGKVADPFLSRFETVSDGTRLRIVDWTPTGAAGTPILLLHGLASNARLWDGPARALCAAGHLVAALDLRGHGLSDKPDSGYSTAEIVGDVVEVIGALAARDRRFGRPLVIGQSWGGNIVVELAARHPDTVRGIVAVDGGTIELSRSFPSWEECERTLRPPVLTGTPHARLRSYIAAAHPDWSDEAIDGQMHNMETREDGTVSARLTLERHMTILRHLWEHVPSRHWSTMSVPVLFTPAAKGNDAHVEMKRRQIDAALAAIPRARVEWFEPADHDLHAQHPGRFAAVVDQAISTGFFR